MYSMFWQIFCVRFRILIIDNTQMKCVDNKYKTNNTSSDPPRRPWATFCTHNRDHIICARSVVLLGCPSVPWKGQRVAPGVFLNRYTPHVACTRGHLCAKNTLHPTQINRPAVAGPALSLVPLGQGQRGSDLGEAWCRKKQTKRCCWMQWLTCCWTARAAL